MTRFWIPLILMVAGCSFMPKTRVVSASANGIAFEIGVGQEDEATRRAMLYCANLGRNANLTSANPRNDGHTIAVYQCQ
jgi:hypothetical protein